MRTKGAVGFSAYGARKAAIISMGHFCRREGVAAMALFLASPASAYVTGQVIGIEGVMRI